MTLTSISLGYDLICDEDTSFESAPPLQFSSAVCDIEVADGKLEAHLKGAYSSVEEARAVVEPLLRAWIIRNGVSVGRSEFRVKSTFASYFLDRPPDSLLTLGTPTITFLAAGRLQITLRNKYPDFPADFIASPLVETLWHRYRGHLLGREPLLSMAYFCLTAVQIEAGGRHQAYAQFGVEEGVLRKIGELTSRHGDDRSARKVVRNQLPLTGQEQRWLEAAVKALILRIGGASANVLATLRLTDLPLIVGSA